MIKHGLHAIFCDCLLSLCRCGSIRDLPVGSTYSRSWVVFQMIVCLINRNGTVVPWIVVKKTWVNLVLYGDVQRLSVHGKSF